MSRRKRAGILTTLLALIEFGVIPNKQNGFYCNDPSIAFRFMGDTISITMLLLGTFLLPMIFTYSTEWLLLRYHVKEELSSESEDEDSVAATRGKIFSNMKPSLQFPTSPYGKAKAALISTWPWYREFLLGLVVNFLIMDIIKVLVGAPRPHFLDTCRPDVAANCTSGYVDNYKCTNTWDTIWSVRDATRSFPSGHASVSVYTSLFMMWFIRKRIPETPSFLLIPFLYCLWCLWAIFCSITRILDHRHHWWDVLAGTILGIAVTVFTVKTQCRGSLPVVNVDPENAHFFLPRLPTRKARQNCASGARGENAHEGQERKQWVRHLLSSSSSGTPEERELKDVALS
ncbi:phospholipid phosphatase 1-like isoform X2 [Ischnura elegans]|uniref:phospholipid phosphatase 1-like isoform X2 n=1 Tax=Ischnura elegans TaxID=197161 RepID=UPI001ED8A45D|nr:phospholipid phosphatase 1-like isoform X2 [Ischnura elegans]